jgi:hypothetical protein
MPDVNHFNVMSCIIDGLTRMNKGPELCPHLLENTSHVPSDFQIYFITDGVPVRIEVMLVLLVDNGLDKILPIVNGVIMDRILQCWKSWVVL